MINDHNLLKPDNFMFLVRDHHFTDQLALLNFIWRH